MYNKKELLDKIRKLKVYQIEKNYFQLMVHLNEKDWRILRDDEYWEDRLTCASELSRKLVTLVHFAMKRHKLDSNTIFKMHNDLEEYEKILELKEKLKKLQNGKV
jgi:hypothetical protein